MKDAVFKLDEARAEAIAAAVSAGGAESLQAAIESALDAWLADQALARLPDDVLRRLWDQGVAEGETEPADFDALKAAARALVGAV
jgi:Arc/MetJ-type ribon-helix-helix transcriptional regulator